MKTNIRIKFKRETGGIILNNIIGLNLLDQNNVADLINEIKSKTNQLQYFDLIKAELYFGSQLMKPEEFVPNETGISILFTIK